MKDSDYLSDELVNAFVDDELDDEERGRVLDQAGDDRRVCETQRLKDLVQHAYSNPPPHYSQRDPGNRRARRIVSGAISAVALLAIGVFLGVFMSASSTDRLTRSSELTSDLQANQPQRLILHVASGDPQAMWQALDRAEEILKFGRRVNRPALVEVVANERGVTLLRREQSPFESKINELMQRYHDPETEGGIAFYACKVSLNKMLNGEVEITLLDQVKVDGTALDRIVYRMRQGWTYEKI